MYTKHPQGASPQNGMAAMKARIAERQKIVDDMKQLAQEETAKTIAMLRAKPYDSLTPEAKAFLYQYGGGPAPPAQSVPQETEETQKGTNWLSAIELYGFSPAERFFGQAVYLASGEPVIEPGTPDRLPACYRPGVLLSARKAIEGFDVPEFDSLCEQYFLEGGCLEMLAPQDSAIYPTLRNLAEDALAEGPRPVYLFPTGNEFRLSQSVPASLTNLLTGQADFRAIPGAADALRQQVEVRLGRTFTSGWARHVVGADIVNALRIAAGPAAPAHALKRAGYELASWREGGRMVFACLDMGTNTVAEGSEE